MGRRAVVLVIDACGVGALPDAADYGDAGTDTLAAVARLVGGLRMPALGGLGLGLLTEVQGVPPSADPALHGRLHALGPGKDSISGHWELMGVVIERALPTYPPGFPPELLELLERETGHALICNRPANGLAAIAEFGAEQLRSGALIAYTSQDSVLQLAAHVERVAPAELYEACRRARRVLVGEHAVGRVIARPFDGPEGAFTRTDGRRDYALEPPGRSYLQELDDAGVPVHGVGKIADLFAGQGIGRSHPGADNESALAAVHQVLDGLERGLVFANLIETDQVYGHRKDVEGFARALERIDAHVASLLGSMRPEDLLIVTADHGVDPSHPGTDHTREHAPMLAVTGEMLARRRSGLRLGGIRSDGPLSDVGASVHRWLTGHPVPSLPGTARIS